MLLDEKMRTNGATLFRLRSFAPLIFLPLVAVAVSEAEPIERMIGDFWGGLYEIACFALVAAGIAVRAIVAGFAPHRTSGRNTARQVASVLNTTGPYSLTRNPLYLGNCMIYLGIVLFTQDLLVSLAFALFLVIYYERIILAEEAFLVDRFGDAYRDWAAEVPAFAPRLSGWRRPELPFSPRSALRREFPGWFAAILALGFIEIAQDAFGHEHPDLIDRGWLLAIGVAALSFGAMFVLKRRTRLLRAPGR